MAQAQPKIVLSSSRDIPFNRLVLSQSNVRRVKAGVSIEELAEDIARRTLLQSLNVRPILDAEGVETGQFEVPAGGRRYRALELLVKRKRLAKTAPVPCVVRTDGIAEEDSLAENVQRVALHPLDQFRAFQTLREKGLRDEDIAARFFVGVQVVRQRLKLAAASPKLLELYAEDELTLHQLMAFCVTDDHARQEQVWEALQRAYTKEPYHIRRLLTESAIRQTDKRVRFVGIAAYEAAGGTVMRDLFHEDHGGWLQDGVLLDRLVREKLTAAAAAIGAEGWKRVEAAPEFPYGHIAGLRRVDGEPATLRTEEQAAYDGLRAEYDEIEKAYAEADELPEEADERLSEIEASLAAFDDRPAIYDPKEIARAGAFVSIDSSGALRVERGYVRPEDEAGAAATVDGEEPGGPEPDGNQRAVIVIGGTREGIDPAEEDEGIRPLPDRLLTELTAHRTLALRDALANDPDTAFVAVLHALCLKAFYHLATETCLEIELKSASFGVQAPGLADSASASAIEARHEAWTGQLPREPGGLWDVLIGMDHDSRSMLFAHCAALSVNAVHEPCNRRPRGGSHPDQLARAVGLDMAGAGWAPSIDNYLGRVTKARILEAVREAKGEASAQLIDHLKKPDMAREAERLLAGTGWLPEPLRTRGEGEPGSMDSEEATEGLPAFLSGDGDDAVSTIDAHALAAE